MATPEEVQEACQEMRLESKRWSQKTVQERVRILKKFQEMMIDSLDEITGVISQDCGKSRQDALIEVFVTVDMLNLYIKHAPRWLRRQKISSGLYIFKHCYVEPKPYGTVAIIAPWNYPFALSLPPVLGALLAGNTVLLKPSEVTGAVGVLIEQLFRRIPELSPYIRVLHGDGSVGAALIQSRPDYIFLTGSTPTGKKVMAAAAEHLIPVACELGGKDAMIVLEDADIPAAARWGVWGSFFNTGQTCMAVERVYVVEQVYDEFVRLALEETGKLKVGYTEDLKSPFYLGPVTDPRQVKTIQRHLEDALARGARILTGGTQNEMFFDPTILTDVDHDMLVMKEETFGPLMPIMKVKDEAEAVRLANDCLYGLGASIWGNNLDRAQRIAHQIEAATIVINDTIAQFAISMLPFGGIKQTGYGRTHGKEGLMQFTRPYAYAVGRPPIPWDVATVAREPGRYQMLTDIIHLAFGVTARQRLQPVLKVAESSSLRLQEKRSVNRFGLVAGLAAVSALTGAILTSKRRRGK
jgi:acyl-CoA reductase-like NAD-dependent aldehyde dehydrogenase